MLADHCTCLLIPQVFTQDADAVHYQDTELALKGGVVPVASLEGVYTKPHVGFIRRFHLPPQQHQQGTDDDEEEDSKDAMDVDDDTTVATGKPPTVLTSCASRKKRRNTEPDVPAPA